MDLRNAIGTAFGVDAPTALAFDYPTAAALAGFIANAAAETPVQGQHAQHGSSGHEARLAPPAGAGSSMAEQDPAPGLDSVAADPLRLTEEVSAVVAEVIGRRVATDVPLMEVRRVACRCCVG